jgi:hypothetical protein
MVSAQRAFRRSFARHLAVQSVLLLVIAGCKEKRDLSSSGDAADIPLDVRVEEVFRVGGSGTEADGDSFSGAIEVALDREGRLYVLDRILDRVSVFSPSGEFLSVLGRSGQGPGEFRMPRGIRASGDGQVSVYDPGRMSIVRYGFDGKHLGDVRVAGIPTLSVARPHPFGFIATGRFTARGSESSANGNDYTLPVSLIDEDEGSIKEIYRAWRPTSSLVEVGTGGAISPGSLALTAFSPPLLLAGLADGSVAVVDSLTYRIRVVADSGGVIRDIGRSIQPRVVDETVRRLERDRLRAEAREGANLSRIREVGSRSGDRKEVTRRSELAIEAMVFSEEIPVICDLGIDLEGRIWVSRAGAPPATSGPIDLLDPAGRYLGTIAPEVVEFPAAFGANGLAATVREDSLETPVVRVIRVHGLPRSHPGG